MRAVCAEEYGVLPLNPSGGCILAGNSVGVGIHLVVTTVQLRFLLAERMIGRLSWCGGGIGEHSRGTIPKYISRSGEQSILPSLYHFITEYVYVQTYAVTSDDVLGTLNGLEPTPYI